MPYYVGDTVASYVDNVRYLHRGEIVKLEQIPAEDRADLIWRAFLQGATRGADVSIAKTLPPLEKVLLTRRQSLPDNVTPNGGAPILTVSDKVRAIIEEFEPDTHYFFRINFHHADKTPWPEQYWQFQPGPSAVAQALIVEQSPNLDWRPITGLKHYRFTKEIREIDRYGTACSFGRNSAVRSAGGFVLDAKAFERRDILHEEAFREKPVFFFSDRLVAALKKAKVTGFIFRKVRAEIRQIPPYGETDGRGGVL